MSIFSDAEYPILQCLWRRNLSIFRENFRAGRRPVYTRKKSQLRACSSGTPLWQMVPHNWNHPANPLSHHLVLQARCVQALHLLRAVPQCHESTHGVGRVPLGPQYDHAAQDHNYLLQPVLRAKTKPRRYSTLQCRLFRDTLLYLQ